MLLKCSAAFASPLECAAIRLSMVFPPRLYSVDTQRRQRSLETIQKVTRAMRLVATSKLKADRERRDAKRAFTEPVLRAVKILSCFSPSLSRSTKSENGGQTMLSSSSSAAVLALTTNKGLCGGVNGAVLRRLREVLESHADAPPPDVFVVGARGINTMQQQQKHSSTLTFTPLQISGTSFVDAQLLAEQLCRYSHITLVYNTFVSVLFFDTTVESFSLARGAPPAGNWSIREEEWDEFTKFALACEIYKALTESKSAEQSQRVRCLDGAARSASEMLETLLRIMHRSRQAQITQDLLEIVAGAEANSLRAAEC